ncbi:MAG: HAD family phosphatase [Sneathiella sp.]|nr:HAD family phosphatase [Sneathiella sp.]
MNQNCHDTPELILFDVDNVLCHYSRSIRLHYLAKVTGMDVQEIDDLIFGSGFDLKGDEGEYTVDEYFTKFRALLSNKATTKDWIEAPRVSMPPDNQMLDLVRSLKQTCQVAVLTNNGPALHQSIDDLFPAISEIFGGKVYFSYQFDTAKPDKGIYLKVAERLNIAPNKVLFVDDLSVNTDGAQEAGMKAHHFQGIVGFRAELQELGLL